MNKLTLAIAGQVYPFATAKLNFSLEKMAHQFDAELPPQWAFDKADTVEWMLNGVVIMRGQLDSTSTITDSGRRGLKIKGRSQTANMIDSRIQVDAIYGETFLGIAQRMAKDFGLSVKSSTEKAKKVIESYQINCESPLTSLSQLAKQKNLIMIERDGAILIEEPGQYQVENIALLDGENVSSFEIDRNWTDMFYQYEVQGQFGESDKAVVTYAGANPTRKKIIMADKSQDGESCQDRAEYERNLAIAKGLTVRCQIPGIFPELTGHQLNRLILAKSKVRSFEEKLLIKTVNISVAAQSQSTDVELFRPFAER